jgi:poly(3-hydroxybutyrate) depolymerase
VLLLLALAAAPDPIPVGAGERTVKVGDRSLTVFTYRPKGTADGPLLLVFHGTDRNASEYRDRAVKLADKLGAAVAAPLFGKAEFPVARYQLGGLMADGRPRPRDQWTWSLVPELADALRRPGQPYSLIGHSAGGQFLCRLAGFVDTAADRVVAANPGTLLFPSAEFPFPYGFGELPAELGGEAALRRYLAQPLTLYLGTGDTVQDENFPKGKWPDKQGDSRYARGKAAFAAGQKLAADKGWPFRWRLVEAPGVGHDSTKMFDHPNCLAALTADRR